MTNSYFENIQETLKNHSRAIPCLLLDLGILDQNIETLKSSLSSDTYFRIVVKSLPSPELLDYIMQKINTKKLMVFHQPFLSHLSKIHDHTIDILMGKPMPIPTANYYYLNLETPKGFSPTTQLQWLIDTSQRAKEYLVLAKDLGQKIKMNLEIDVGLRRGGFSNLGDLRKCLSLISENLNYLEFTGFMGYDPHVVKLPPLLFSPSKVFKRSIDFYKKCIELVKNEFPQLWKGNLTFNGAGSPTLNLHLPNQSCLNEVAAGSCLVKPTTFDIPSLKNYLPACFIATPIIKSMKETTIPGIEKLKGVLSFFNKKNKRSYFIYGGFWKADYCYPSNTSENSIFGSSTNQSMINVGSNTNLQVGDFVFLRPHQSEAVFLQFGEILGFRNKKVVARFSLLQQY